MGPNHIQSQIQILKTSNHCWNQWLIKDPIFNATPKHFWPHFQCYSKTFFTPLWLAAWVWKVTIVDIRLTWINVFSRNSWPHFQVSKNSDRSSKEFLPELLNAAAGLYCRSYCFIDAQCKWLPIYIARKVTFPKINIFSYVIFRYKTITN